MRTMRLAVLCLLLAVGLASAQSLTQAQRQAILDYQLTMPKANALSSAMEALTKYVAALPDSEGRKMRLAVMTPAQLRALMEKDAKAMAILTQNGLTTNEYLAGTNALVMAYTIAATGNANPYVFASQANIDFAKGHLSELKPRMDAVRAAARGQ
jgi:hypothetical protein